MIVSSQLSVTLKHVLLINQLVVIACFIESLRAISIIKPVMPQYVGVYLEQLLSVLKWILRFLTEVACLQRVAKRVISHFITLFYLLKAQIDSDSCIFIYVVKYRKYVMLVNRLTHNTNCVIYLSLMLL
jgi:hypothetical protein